MEVVEEVEHGLSPPQPCRQVSALEVGTVTARLRDTDQNLVKAVTDWNYFRAKERIISGGEEEERLPDMIEHGCWTRSFHVVVGSFEASDFSSDRDAVAR